MRTGVRKMFDKLFKKLRKSSLCGWHRGGMYNEPVLVGGNRGRRWIREELSIARFGAVNRFNAIGVYDKSPDSPAKDERKEVKPVEVFKELTSDRPNLDFTNLDAKIKAMKKRIDFMKEDIGVIANEESNVLSWLESRKRSLKGKLWEEFVWPVTTVEKVADLLKKYKLIETTFNEYSLAVPNEAVDEMEKYVTLCKKVTEDKPEFILIVADTPEAKVNHRDPIIVATSPFGKFLHVLGAWDKEVEIMHELYFKNK